MSDQCQSSRRLRPIRGEERTIPVMEFPARNEGHATQQKKKKQRRKTVLISKIYMQEMMQAKESRQPQLPAQKFRQDYRIFMMDSSAVPIMKSSNPAQNDL